MTFHITLLAGVAAASAGSLIFSSLTYALRDYARPILEEYLDRRKQQDRLDFITANTGDLIFATAAARLACNMAILILILRLVHASGWPLVGQYTASILAAATIMLFCSVTIPHAIAKHSAAPAIAIAAPLLRAMLAVFRPVVHLSNLVDAIIRRLLGADSRPTEERIDKEILSVVQEGEKEGVVAPEERVMIESVMEFRDTHAGQIMTARSEIIALPAGSTLEHVKRVLDESGHSRVPVYEGSLDAIKGVLYARDLLKFVGTPVEQFDLMALLRPVLFIPESKPVSNLLNDFRARKVHLAVVLDEYGGTAGLVTIEDVLEELVGEISDEHEPRETASVRPVGDNAFEADGRAYIADVNRLAGLELPEDQGYDTIAGFISTTLARIPRAGTVFEQQHVRFTVLEAEPQRITRVKLERLPAPPDPQ